MLSVCSSRKERVRPMLASDDAKSMTVRGLPPRCVAPRGSSWNLGEVLLHHKAYIRHVNRVNKILNSRLGFTAVHPSHPAGHSTCQALCTVQGKLTEPWNDLKHDPSAPSCRLRAAVLLTSLTVLRHIILSLPTTYLALSHTSPAHIHSDVSRGAHHGALGSLKCIPTPSAFARHPER